MIVDLDVASQCLDVAWLMNTKPRYCSAIDKTYAARTSRLIFNSLIQRSVASVLRSMDTNRTYASIPTFSRG